MFLKDLSGISEEFHHSQIQQLGKKYRMVSFHCSECTSVSNLYEIKNMINCSTADKELFSKYTGYVSGNVLKCHRIFHC